MFLCSNIYCEEQVLPASMAEVSTPVYRPVKNLFNPKLGTYDYEVSWQGIPAATASIKVEKRGDEYFVTTSAKTNSAIDILYTLRYEAIGNLSDEDYRPIKTVINQQENSKIKITKITFNEDGSIDSFRQTNDKEPKVEELRTNNNTLDPFAAVFLARSLEWNTGKSYVFDTYNGKSRYLITLTAVEKEEIEINGVKRSAFIIKPTVKNLTNPKNNGKLREAKIYVSDDDSREILKIVSSVFIGSVTTNLEKFTKLPESGIQVALAR